MPMSNDTSETPADSGNPNAVPFDGNDRQTGTSNGCAGRPTPTLPADAHDEPGGPQPIPTPPDVIEWALSQINEEEIAAALREIQETGGYELSDFIRDLERAAGIHE
jgi:hypothetical protein